MFTWLEAPHSPFASPCAHCVGVNREAQRQNKHPSCARLKINPQYKNNKTCLSEGLGLLLCGVRLTLEKAGGGTARDSSTRELRQGDCFGIKVNLGLGRRITVSKLQNQK